MTQIWFVTWPDGKVLEGSQTSISRSFAIIAAIRSFLPERWFPEADIGSDCYGAGFYLWPSMKKAGFQVQSIKVPGAIGVSR